MQAVGEVLDGGTVHWLAALLPPRRKRVRRQSSDRAEPVLRRTRLESYWPRGPTESVAGAKRCKPHLRGARRRRCASNGSAAASIDVGSHAYPSGGTLRLTALGRYVFTRRPARRRIRTAPVDDLADAPASASHRRPRLGARRTAPNGRVDAWRLALELGGRVDRSPTWLDRPTMRRCGSRDSAALGVVRCGCRRVRQCADCSTAPPQAHAALYLLSRGLADGAEVSGLIDIGVFVDVLAASLDEPDELYEMFSAARHSADQYAALEQMWQHASPTPPLCSTRSANTYPTASSPRPPARPRSSTAVGSPTAPEVLALVQKAVQQGRRARHMGAHRRCRAVTVAGEDGDDDRLVLLVGMRDIA